MSYLYIATNEPIPDGFDNEGDVLEDDKGIIYITDEEVRENAIADSGSGIPGVSMTAEGYGSSAKQSARGEAVCSLMGIVEGTCSSRRANEESDVSAARNSYYKDKIKKNQNSLVRTDELKKFVSNDISGGAKLGSIISDEESARGGSGVEGGLTLIGQDIEIGNDDAYAEEILRLEKIQEERTLTDSELKQIQSLKAKTATGSVENFIQTILNYALGLIGVLCTVMLLLWWVFCGSLHLVRIVESLQVETLYFGLL